MKIISLFFRLGRGNDLHHLNKYKPLSLNLIFFSVIFCTFMFSCKKEEIEDDSKSISTTNSDVVRFTINGKQYDESISPNIHFIPNDNVELCDSKRGVFEIIGAREPDSRFTIYNFGLIYVRLNADFKNSKTGTFPALQAYLDVFNPLKKINPCNLTLCISLEDNGKRTNLIAGSNSITKITLIKTNSTYTDYQIEGRFGGNFVNANNEGITLTCTYKKVIQVFNQ